VVVGALALAWTGCAERSAEMVVAQVGRIEYVVPEGWVMRDVSQSGQTILVWTPSDNSRKESITLIRTPPMPHLVRGGQGYLAAKLGATLQQPGHTVMTKHGLEAARVDGSLQPRGLAGRYARSHAVVVDDDALVHIIYTAKTPDPALFDRVLDGVERKAG
jgi:hypothetical protein